MRVIVWTKAWYCLSEPIPTNTAFSPADELVIQKVMEDVFMTMTLEELVATINETGKPFPLMPPQHEKLNANKTRYAGDAADFQDAYRQEVAYTVNFHGKAIHDVFMHLFLEKYGYEPMEPFRDQAPGIQKTKDRLYGGMIADQLPKDLPCFHIESAIHAAMKHAAMAMPYYDFFFTESSLAHFVKHPPLSFDKLYGAKVLSKEDDILKLLESF